MPGSIMVATGFSPTGYLQYGKNFMETFDNHWPKSARLVAFTEEPVDVPRGGLRSLWTCQGIKKFLDDNANNLGAKGLQRLPQWGPKDINKGYSYKWDAVKFSRQCVIPNAAAEELEDGDILSWIDGDVVTHTDVPEGFIEGLFGKGDLCYLGRVKGTSEIGFWAVKLNGSTRQFLKQLADIYTTGNVFSLREWHSAYCFDHVRVIHEKLGRIHPTNITPQGHGHVWFQSPLCKFTDHLKGERRKTLGRSEERRG